MTSILTGWRQQYDRMLRSHQRLHQIAEGAVNAPSSEATDALIHFLQDAYHLKDWVKKDDSVTTTNVENHIKRSSVMRLCADLCNGTKHLKLTSPKTGDKEAAISSQGTVIRLGSTALHEWTVSSKGRDEDALEFTDKVVKSWSSWLTKQGLI
jgi:hypothetical protein